MSLHARGDASADSVVAFSAIDEALTLGGSIVLEVNAEPVAGKSRRVPTELLAAAVSDQPRGHF